MRRRSRWALGAPTGATSGFIVFGSRAAPVDARWIRTEREPAP